MTCKELSAAADIASAAALSVRAHEGLRAQLPFLPVRSEADLGPRIEWVTRKGVVLGLVEEGRLQAFLGAFPLESFRNGGPGSVGPDWCHGPSTLAINGMYVEAGSRRTGVGCRLLGSLAREAGAADKTVVSVDFETTNLEAYAFWTRWFRPVTWSLERRV